MAIKKRGGSYKVDYMVKGKRTRKQFPSLEEAQRYEESRPLESFTFFMPQKLKRDLKTWAAQCGVSTTRILLRLIEKELKAAKK